MTECQGCGAWNERHRSLCVLCGTPLAETDEWDAAAEPPPLPPLPDGGLSATMPAWLRALPDNPGPNDSPLPVFLTTTEEAHPASILTTEVPLVENAEAGVGADQQEPVLVSPAPVEQSLGPQADPRTFLRDDDFPRWIRELPALPPRPVPPVTVMIPSVAEPAVLVEPANLPPPLVPRPYPPQKAGALQQDRQATLEAMEPPPAPTPPAALPAAPSESAARRREAWETPLLVILVVGVIAAVIWALLVNGLIGNGL